MAGVISHVTFDLIVSGVDTMLPFAEGYAKITETKWDDSAVAAVKTIRGSQALMKWLHDLLCKHEEIVEKSGAARDAAIQAALAGADGDLLKRLLDSIGVAYDKIEPYLPIAIRLLLTVIGLRS